MRAGLHEREGQVSEQPERLVAGRRQNTPEDLQLAVDKLITRQRVKLRREHSKVVEWQTIPSLWEQLETSVMWGGGQGGGSSGFGARPVISTSVVALIIEIGSAAAEGAVEFSGKSRQHVPKNLRAVAANLPADQDLLDWWTDTVKRWAREVRVALRLDPERPQWARNTMCPECGADQATARRDGEDVRTPALAISWAGPEDDEHHPDSDWKVRAVDCRACGSTWWRGEPLESLVDQMLIANATRETMTKGVAS